MENYFNYFTEIEEHFHRRRGSTLLLSTLDWALIETWKDAGIPLAAVLRGIDETFDRYERRPAKTRKINGLAYCSQEVLAAAEEMKEAAVGTARSEKPPANLPAEEIAVFVGRNAGQLEGLLGGSPGKWQPIPEGAKGAVRDCARALGEIAGSEDNGRPLEELERRLTVLEEKLFAALLAATPDEELVAARAEADRELAPYRRKMSGAQIGQLQRQYVNKRLLERYGLPRLSLFYMQ